MTSPSVFPTEGFFIGVYECLDIKDLYSCKDNFTEELYSFGTLMKESV